MALGGGGGGSAGRSDTMGAEKEWTVGGGRGIDFRGGGQAKGHGRGESQRLHGYGGDGGRGGGGGLGSKGVRRRRRGTREEMRDVANRWMWMVSGIGRLSASDIVT